MNLSNCASFTWCLEANIDDNDIQIPMTERTVAELELSMVDLNCEACDHFQDVGNI